MEVASNFGALDWAIIVLYLVATVGIALAVRRLVSDMDDYVVAGRGLRSWLSVATLVGSELGLVTVMYSAQKGFTGGFATFHIPLVAGVTTLLIGMTGFIVVPLREMGVMTIPEFYERRFGRGVRILGGTILAFAGILNMGLFLRAGSIFVTELTGLRSEMALKLVMTGLLALVLFYVVLGGMLAVVITDYVQFIVLSVGMLASCWFALRRVSWEGAVAAVREVHGNAGFDPLDGGGFGPGYVIWMIFTAGIVSAAVWQTAVMRASSADSTETVRRMYVFSSIGFVIRFLLPNFLGICALAWVFGDPGVRDLFEAAGGMGSPDATLAVMPAFLGQLLPTGLLGLVGAGMLAAFMSTHDSYLLCWSSVLTQDVIAPLFGERMTEKARLVVVRVLVAAIGIFLLVWSLWYPLQQDLWDYMAVTGAIYFTGAFALLLLGIYWRGASRFGAYLALFAGLTAAFGLGPVKSLFGITALEQAWSFELTGEVAGLSAVSLCLVLMVVGSLLRPDPPREERV